MNFGDHTDELKQQGQKIPDPQVNNPNLDQVSPEEEELNEEQLGEITGGVWAPDPYDPKNYKKHIPKGAF